VSTRHLSWLESGRAEPSRAMVLRLAEQLDVPLRERNALLAAAGYAPLYRRTTLTDPLLAPARQALQRLLDAHEPWPALAVDRHWQLLAANRMVGLLLQDLPPALLQPPLNVLRLSLHPQGLAPRIANLPAWREHVLARLRRQADTSADPALQTLHDELAGWPLPVPVDDTGAETASATLPDFVVPLSLLWPKGAQGRDGPARRLNFITTVTVFGAPHDVTLQELAVETLLPADAATAEALRQAHAALG
jgi:transcriptional regulator with XRE-family HTH domain